MNSIPLCLSNPLQVKANSSTLQTQNSDCIELDMDDEFERVIDEGRKGYEPEYSAKPRSALSMPRVHAGSNRREIDLENISESESSQQSLERQEESRPRRAASEMSRLKTSQMYHDSAVIAEEALFAELCSKLIEDEHLATAHTAFALSAPAGFYGHEPNTYAEAVNCKDQAMWKHAMDKEMDGLNRLDVFESVPLSQIPSGTN